MVRHLRNRHFFASDVIALAALPIIAYMLRVEGFQWTPEDTHTLIVFTGLVLPLKVSIYLLNGLYDRLWSQATVGDLVHILRGVFISGVASCFLGGFLLTHAGLVSVRVPLSVLVIDALGTLAVVTASRALPKMLKNRQRAQRAGDPAVLIVGAGSAGEIIAKELAGNPRLKMRAVGFLDDDPAKRELQLCGLPVLGSLAELPEMIRAHKVSEVIITMPEAHGPVVRGVMRMASEAGARTRTIPAISEMLSDSVSVSTLRKLEISDLLRREPVHTDLDAVRKLVGGAPVLVTGAGGSIGGELCRQLARLGPSRLLLLGHGENSIFEIQSSLRAAFPELELVPVIADVRDEGRMRDILAVWRPRVVFHAAAHKHVPLMETNVAEAVLNNVLGTMSLVDAAVAAGTQHLVLISSDKAVRPCSVMGTTKRIAEMVVQQAAIAHNRHFVAVRFGNVLGSRGSVVPTFLKQIESGGPITVTDPRMRRFFMTIPEAVQLVLQAGALGHRGEVFVLDMGEPVRIVDLATDLVRLSGMDPGEIEIRVTGVRPGERLDEEVLISGESALPTSHPKVLRATNGHLPLSVDGHIRTLVAAARERQPDSILRLLLMALVPEATLPPAPGTLRLSSGGSRTAAGHNDRAEVLPLGLPAAKHASPR